MSRPSASLRSFRIADMPACLEAFDSNVPEYFRESERPDFETFLRNLPGPYLVLEEARSVVGCGGYALRDTERVADLCWGMVHRGHHGRGLGRALTVRRVEAARRDPRVRTIALNTSQHTVGFYEKLGFVVLSRARDGYAPGLDRCEMSLEV